ncbi:MAG: TRZ/ATZ family hydrolase [Gammaproteobacteria bacterium]|nr:TRZ/ATZ family hydrolase [Gammaproteobacteria bacterium]
MSTNYQIILAEWIVTVNPEFEVLTDYAIVIKDSHIHDLLPTTDINYLEYYQQADVFDLPNHVIMPGLVNSHTHASMSLLRGLGDDLPLMEWLNDHIWPAEGRWVNTEFVRNGFELAAAEMMRSGTTCFNDMYFYPDTVAQHSQQIGLRAVVGLIVLDFPTAWAKDADDYLHKALAVYDEIKASPLVTAAFAPHAPYTVSDSPLERIAMYSNELDMPVHMHIHETAFEVAEAEKNTGMRPLQRLDQLNLLNPNLIAVHMTELNEFEIERIAEAGVHVSHCPESNLKLASGLCPVAELQNSNINICLGTDGAASNNDLDMFAEMRTATLLAKGVSGDARNCSARQAIEMATINGARALGLGNDIGSIEAGKQADIIALDFTALNTQPTYDPVTQVVYACNSRQVSHVWIAGNCQLADFQLCNIDEDKIRHQTQSWRSKIASTDKESA